VAPASHQRQVQQSLASTAVPSTDPNADSVEISFEQLEAQSPTAKPTPETYTAPGLSKAAIAFITNGGKAKWTNNPLEVKALKV
jgi:hypothetical protein